MFPNFKIGIKCSTFRNIGNIITVNDLIIMKDSIGDKRYLIVLNILLQYLEVLELLFFILYVNKGLKEKFIKKQVYLLKLIHQDLQ